MYLKKMKNSTSLEPVETRPNFSNSYIPPLYLLSKEVKERSRHRFYVRGLGVEEGGENDQGNENGNKSDAGRCAVWRRFRLAHRTQ